MCYPVSMSRIKYEYITPTTFEEHLNFTKDEPYTLRIKRFIHEDVVPLHYAKTIEILVAQGLSGKLVVGNQSYPLHGNQVFVIPPNTVHGNDILPGDGVLYVLKLDIDVLEEFVNLSSILKNSGGSLSTLAHYYPEEDFQKVFDVIMELIGGDSDFCYCISLIVKLFSFLKNRTQPSLQKIQVGKSLRNIDLHKLIRWTQDNLSNRITIQDVADQFGYSKCYFCSRFKQMTGFTYYEYLTSARISYACQLLLLNYSVQETCYMAGFENVSYFIQLFKKYQGMTPKEYARAFAYANTTEIPSLANINKNPD